MLSELYISEYTNNNKSGKMSSERYVSNNFKEDYEIILNYCDTNDLDLPFKEKVYHTINKISTIVLCKNPQCNKPVKFKNSTIGYVNYCSNKCVGTDPNIKKKRLLHKRFEVTKIFTFDIVT